MAEGTCKLTRSKGKFVRAHLIPKALTRPEEPGLSFKQFGQDGRLTRRWDSWYDSQLVTERGEEILAELDSWAIEALRKHRLIWSGWGPAQKLAVNDHFEYPGGGVRRIQVIDGKRLRLFCLSLLWRAAATDRLEFEEVVLKPAELENLRLMVCQGETEPVSFYPAALVQLSTLGDKHNQSPIVSTKLIPSVGVHAQRNIPIFRFYFEGLVIHIHRHASDDGYTESMGPTMVGGDDTTLFVTTVPYETSWERDNLLRHQVGAWLNERSPAGKKTS